MSAGGTRRALPRTAAARRLASVGLQVPRTRPLSRPVDHQDLDELQRPGTLQAADGLRLQTTRPLERRSQHLYSAVSTQRQGT